MLSKKNKIYSKHPLLLGLSTHLVMLTWPAPWQHYPIVKHPFRVRLSIHVVCRLPVAGWAGKSNRSIFRAEMGFAMFPNTGNLQVPTAEDCALCFKWSWFMVECLRQPWRLWGQTRDTDWVACFEEGNHDGTRSENLREELGHNDYA